MIYLLRHGTTDWNKAGKIQGQEDIPLNLDGIRQAMENRDIFEGHKLTKVVSSPLSRALKTAQIMTSRADVEQFEVDPRLIEFDFGNRSGTDLKKDLEDEQKNSRKSPSKTDEEDESAFLQRIFGALIENAQLPGNVVLVTHGAVIGTIIRSLLPEEYSNTRFPLENCSVTVIEPTMEDNTMTLTLRGIGIPKEELEEILTENDEVE